MKTNTLDRTSERAAHVEKALLLMILSWLACIQISIAASQILLSVVILLWVVDSLGRGRFVWPPRALLFSIALFGSLSLLSASFSPTPGRSLAESKELLLLVIPIIVVGTARTTGSVEKMVLVLLAVACATALVGLWQFSAGNLNDIHHRIRGLVGHYMTYSGLLMSMSAVALAGWLFAPRFKLVYAVSFLLLSSTLLLTLTRSAWLGMLFAGTCLLFLRDRRLLLALPLALGIAWVAQPDTVRQRLDTFVRPDVSGLDRVAMLETGSRMVATHPWLGVGTDMVARLYPIYVSQTASIKENPHLHNNLMQLAAERGLPCLAAWLGMLLLLGAEAIRQFRNPTEQRYRYLAAGALGVWVAGFVAGLFEYNFGDSEYQMMFLFLLSVPFALRRLSKQEPV